MSQVVPPRFLFRLSFPVRYCPDLPGSKTECSPLPSECRLPRLETLDGATPFADLFVAWNETGFGIGVEVRGKQEPLACDPLKPLHSDGLQLWLDTRCTQNVHRATRFCHHFCVLPTTSRKGKASPVASQHALAQAREETGARGKGALLIKSVVHEDGYRLDCWFPAETLFGFDPATHPRLGFYVIVKDAELGEQFLTVGREFPFEFDPSMWQTLELVR